MMTSKTPISFVTSFLITYCFIPVYVNGDQTQATFNAISRRTLINNLVYSLPISIIGVMVICQQSFYEDYIENMHIYNSFDMTIDNIHHLSNYGYSWCLCTFLSDIPNDVQISCNISSTRSETTRV